MKETSNDRLFMSGWRSRSTASQNAKHTTTVRVQAQCRIDQDTLERRIIHKPGYQQKLRAETKGLTTRLEAQERAGQCTAALSAAHLLHSANQGLENLETFGAAKFRFGGSLGVRHHSQHVPCRTTNSGDVVE